MKDKGTARELLVVPPGKVPTDLGIVSPLGAVLKNSDKARARTLVGEETIDQKSLTEANVRLKAMNMPQQVKVRMSQHVRATGVSDDTPNKPYTNNHIWSALALLYRGCYMAKGDVSRYYHSFSIAMESRWMILCVLLGVLYQIVRMTFGFKLRPYGCG